MVGLLRWQFGPLVASRTEEGRGCLFFLLIQTSPSFCRIATLDFTPFVPFLPVVHGSFISLFTSLNRARFTRFLFISALMLERNCESHFRMFEILFPFRPFPTPLNRNEKARTLSGPNRTVLGSPTHFPVALDRCGHW